MHAASNSESVFALLQSGHLCPEVAYLPQKVGLVSVKLTIFRTYHPSLFSFLLKL